MVTLWHTPPRPVAGPGRSVISDDPDAARPGIRQAVAHDGAAHGARPRDTSSRPGQNSEPLDLKRRRTDPPVDSGAGGPHLTAGLVLGFACGLQELSCDRPDMT